MKYLRFLVADFRKNVLTEQFLWGISICIAVELLVMGVYYERQAVKEAAAASQPPCDGVP